MTVQAVTVRAVAEPVGAMMTVECPACQFQSPLLEGCGFIAEVIGYGYCETCEIILSQNVKYKLLQKRNPPDFTDLECHNDHSHPLRVFEVNITETPSATDEDLVDVHFDGQCPRCKQASLEFRTTGCWD